ncbi:MAG: cyclic nucleotide-binding domain-containing protein [Saccharospirillum sp.]|nr:cyclic nucleotide-binding domain-containing protein [Saccharospirillum sp.]
MNRTLMDKLKPVNYTPLEVAELIDKTNWANEFGWEEIRKLGAYFTTYQVSKGTVIFYEGARADYMGLIISGKIRISKTSPDRSVRPLVVLTESQTFGEQSLIDGEPRSGLAEAIADTTFVITSRRQLFRMAEEEPELAFKVLWKISRMISQRLRHTSLKLLDSTRLS